MANLKKFFDSHPTEDHAYLTPDKMLHFQYQDAHDHKRKARLKGRVRKVTRENYEEIESSINNKK